MKIILKDTHNSSSLELIHLFKMQRIDPCQFQNFMENRRSIRYKQALFFGEHTKLNHRLNQEK